MSNTSIGGLKSLDLKNHYDTDADNILEEFYKPVLKNSIIYKRAVGYFSDAVLRACAQELTDFIESEGKIYLVIGTFISETELLSIQTNEINDQEQKLVKVKLIASLKRLSENSGESIAIIGRLVEAGIAEIRIAARDKGIYHEKYGIFEDIHGAHIAFIGSANETSSALGAQINHESFSVFTSEDTYIYEKYGRDLENKFQQLWNGKLKNTRVYKLDEEILEILKNLTREYNDRKLSGGGASLPPKEQLPAIPKATGLRSYQKEALNKWHQNNFSGILAMATGTGKTLTAINALENFRKSVPSGFIIVVVPYQNLAIQWIEAIQNAGINSIAAFQSYKNWYDRFKEACLAATLEKTDAPCVVVVEDTFKSDRFQEMLALLENVIEKNHLIIADECHHFNAPQHIAYLPKFFRYRLGLSATPYDQFSEKYLDIYFGNIVYEFTLAAAIKAGYLCPYDYHVVEVTLDDEETEQYEIITKKIVQLIGADEKITPENLSKIQPYLLQRARVVGAAQDKIIKLKDLISRTGKQNYALVYCGDGSNEDDYGDRTRQIDQVTYLLHTLKWNVARVTAEESLMEREQTIEALKNKLIDAIVSIRVLDEGIDIPACRTAYFLASQRSERQHVQRRGRVLRLSEGKEKATIYDFVVTGAQSDSLAIKSLVKKELERVWRFAQDALNGKETIEGYSRLAVKVDFLEGNENGL
jgi:superfamily II DNA or RNA helicase